VEAPRPLDSRDFPAMIQSDSLSLKRYRSCDIETSVDPTDKPARWLILIHQIPPKPHYFRIKVGRRLARLGAVAIKNSIYALPWSDAAYEDFQWLVREINRDGGEASMMESRLLEGLDDDAVEALFHTARDADYAELAEEAKSIDEPTDADVERLR